MYIYICMYVCMYTQKSKNQLTDGTVDEGGLYRLSEGMQEEK